MIKANIVIIDSGLDYNLQDKNNIIGGICFYQSSNGQINKHQTYNDVYGHGTAIYNIINDNCNDATFYFVKIFNNAPKCNQDLLFYSLKYVCENIKCDFILLSSGTVKLNSVKEFDHITERLYQVNKTIIISAFSNEGALSYPAAGKFVIGVDSSPVVSKQDSHYIIKGSPVNILCNQHSYRITWLNGNKLIEKGNSYLAAFITAKLFYAYKQTGTKKIEKLLQCIKKDSNEIIFDRPCFNEIMNPSFLSKKKKLRAIAFPFSKEINVLAANEDLLQVEIIDYYDIRESGKIGLEISDVLGYGNNAKKIKRIDNIEKINKFELIICGHLDLLNQITKQDWKNKLKEIAEKEDKYLYFFDYDTDRGQNNIYSPPYIQRYNGYTLGKLWPINSPVLGIFGTSSVQGKFSLQLKLRRAFLEDGYLIKQISTEPTGALFGMDFTCPIGYNSSIKLKGNDAAKLYNQLVHECDITDPDLILIGCQSATLPYSFYHEQFFTFQQIEFLFGTNPDAVVLVINKFDDLNYIKRTINFIESSVQTKVLACVISPVNSTVTSDFEFDNLSDILKMPVYDYNTQFDLLYQSIIKYFGGIK